MDEDEEFDFINDDIGWPNNEFDEWDLDNGAEFSMNGKPYDVYMLSENDIHYDLLAVNGVGSLIQLAYYGTSHDSIAIEDIFTPINRYFLSQN
jgi:hypothetical protein